MQKNIRTFLAGVASILFLSGIGINFLYAQTGTTNTTTSNTDASLSTTSTTDTTSSLTNTTSSGVTLADTTPPIIKLNGDGIVYLKVGVLYNELGAVAYDNIDGNISERIIRESNVNTALPGVYHVVYGVRDRAGNIAKATRIVYVVAPPPPITTQTQTTTVAPTEPVKIEPTINTAVTPSVTLPPRDSIEAQTDRLLEILRQGNIQRIEEEKSRIIRNATSSPRIPLNIRSTSTPQIPGAVAERIEERREVIEEKIKKILERTQKIPAEVRLDSDHDGVSNYDEIHIYGTDSQSADTDGDGYSDRAEITTGFDPKDPDLQAAIIYENPKDSGEIKKDLLTVAAITIAETKTEDKKQAISKVSFKGKGLPNSFVTIYIFSTPTVITVKTDDEGNWEYLLDKELDNGNHEMYVAMTDNAGKILAKSNAIPFVKEANAITVDQNFLTPISGGKSPSLLWGEYMYAAVTVILSVIGIIFAIIGMRAQPSYRRYRNPTDTNDSTGDGK